MEGKNTLETIAKMLNGMVVRTHFPFKTEICDVSEICANVVTMKLKKNEDVFDLEIRIEWYPHLPLNPKGVQYPNLTERDIILTAEGHSIYREKFDSMRNSLAIATVNDIQPGEYILQLQ